MSKVPEIRVRKVNDAPVRSDGEFVLYWMIAGRRRRYNFALQRAVEWAGELGRPLMILEALWCDYPWASDRLHRFILDGMRDTAEQLKDSPAFYYPFVETHRGGGKGLLRTLAGRACLVVTDEFTAFFLPGMVKSVGRKLPVLLEAVDSNGLLPLREADRVFPTAHSFRRFLHKNLKGHLGEFPVSEPLDGLDGGNVLAHLPKEIEDRWPPAPTELLTGDAGALSRLPIDHTVAPVDLSGGQTAATKTARDFVDHRLDRYADDARHPDLEIPSGLSPYLHFGYISAHEVFTLVAHDQDWTVDDMTDRRDGARTGWWNMSKSAEAFLDQLVTWREVGFNMCFMCDDYDRYESLPDWARQTLDEHAGDERPYLYSFEEFETASTHDELWNAAQNQLVREGRLHNYMRMVWGKKILHWSESPQRALEIMIELNDKHALDGRDPNSYSGIFWVLGRYDHAWGPERPVFGKIRYMSLQNTRRKVRVSEYLRRYGR